MEIDKHEICEECKKRKAVLEWTRDEMNTLRTGFGKINSCRECYIGNIKKHIKDCKENLKEQEKLLETEGDKNG